MFAPQYPEGLRLDIYSLHAGRRQQRAGPQGDQRPQPLHRHARPGRSRTSPSSSGCRSSSAPSACCFLRAAVHGTVGDARRRLRAVRLLRAFSLWSFGYKLYRYGHDLAPTAAVQVPPFMPPMFGYKQLANFEVYSYPRPASYAMAGASCCSLAALCVDWWQRARRRAARSPRTGHDAVRRLRRCCCWACCRAPADGRLTRRRRAARGPPGRRRTRRRCRRGSTRRARATASRCRPAPTSATCSSTSPLTLVGTGRPRLRRVGHRQRRARARRPT